MAVAVDGENSRAKCRMPVKIARLVSILSVAGPRKRADTDALVLDSPEAQSWDLDGKDSFGRDFAVPAGPRDRNRSDVSRKYFLGCLDIEQVGITGHG